MMAGDRLDRGLVRVIAEECKGCGLCVEACPPRVIALGDEINHYGYRTAAYKGGGCTGCGVCFMVCPEPGAITVLRMKLKGMGGRLEWPDGALEHGHA